MNNETINIENMDNKELKELIKKRFETAIKDGTTTKLYIIGRELGKSLNCKYGPKYQFKHNDTILYIDDYGGYMTIKTKEKTVYSDHVCDKFIIPCKEINELLSFYSKALNKKNEKNNYKYREERKKLLPRIL